VFVCHSCAAARWVGRIVLAAMHTVAGRRSRSPMMIDALLTIFGTSMLHSSSNTALSTVHAFCLRVEVALIRLSRSDRSLTSGVSTCRYP
jgi:hypothetical protein